MIKRHNPYIFLWCALAIAACHGHKPIPFPNDGAGLVAPVTEPLVFGPPVKIDWPKKPVKIGSTPVELRYAQLPEAKFDSVGFQPMTTPPNEVTLKLDQLPSADFDLGQVADSPLHFKFSPIPPPVAFRPGRPGLKSIKGDMIFSFPEPLNTPVTNVLATHDGFLWITGAMGLYRFDGENLFQYKINNLSGTILKMVEDKEGKIWIASRRCGLFVIDPHKGVSGNLGTQQGLPSDVVVKVMVDHHDRVWAAFVREGFAFDTDGGGGFTLVIDQHKNTGKFLRRGQGLHSDEPGAFAEDKDHHIWVGSAHRGICILDEQHHRVSYLDRTHGLSTDSITDLLADSKGRIWASSFFGQVNVIDPGRQAILQFSESQGLKRTLFGLRAMIDHRGNVWIGADDRVTVIDSTLRRVKTIDRRLGLAAGGWGSVAEDGRRQMWLASSAGLYLMNRDGFNIYRSGTVQVSSQLDDSHGKVWIGTTDNGIAILDTATGKMKIYDKAHGLGDNFVQYILTRHRQIFISTQNSGLEIIDSSLRHILRIGKKEGLLHDIMLTETDNGENLWLCGPDKGIDVLDLRKKELYSIGTRDKLGTGGLVDLQKDRQGRLWFLSTVCGLGIINLQDTTYRHVAGSKYRELNGRLDNNLLLHDSRDNTWITTSANGLFLINPRGDSLTHLDISNGLLSNRCSSIHEYEGRIYVGTSKGLNIITPPWKSADRQWKMDAIGRWTGISKTVSTYNSDLMLKDGEFWWGDDGITHLSKTEQYLADTVAPATCITGFDLLDVEQRFYPGDKTRDGMRWDSLSPMYQTPVNLRLPHTDNFIRFRFAQMHLASQDTIWYRYILEGVDRKWSDKTNQPFSDNYPNMAPGTYTFKVASVYRGKWSAPASFSFTILTPWWTSWWAWMIYIFGVFFLLRGYILYRGRRLLKENRVLEEKVALRTTQLQSSIEELKATQSQLIQSEKMASLGELTAGIAHEIQNPLNFINNFAEINKELLTELKDELTAGNLAAATTLADDVIANEEKINHHGRRADGIVKSMLQHSRSNQHSVKEPTDLNKLADEYLRLAYHGLRAKDKSFNASLKTAFDPAVGTVMLLGNDMGRVILNLITNAFYAVGERNAQAKAAGVAYEPTVTVTTRRLNGKVEVVVQDNGNGIPAAIRDKIFQPFFTTKPTGQGTGLGLSMSYEIVKKGHAGELKVESVEGQGTSFTIVIPS